MRYFQSLILLSIMAAGASAVDIGIGIDGGLQLAWFDRWVVEVPTAGINLPLYITDEHCVQISARYSPKGYKYDSANAYDSQWLHYLDIPVVYRYFPNFLPIKLGVELGYNFCFLMTANIKGFDGFEPFPPDQPYTDFYKTFDHGPLVGINFKYPLPVGELTAAIVFYRGLTVVRDKWPNASGTYTDPKNNHALAMLLGYELPNVISIGGK